MRVKFSLFFFLVLSQLIQNSHASSVLEKITMGDKFYEERKDFKSAMRALELFNEALKESPNSVEALWRSSMANYYIGHLKESAEERLAFYKQGEKLGEKCMDISDKRKVECIFWTATNKILLKKEAGKLSLAFGISKVTNLFKLAVEVDPSYASYGPYRMLSLIYRKLPGFLGGDNQRSYSYILKALEKEPHDPLILKTYLKFLVEDKNLEKALMLAKEYLKNSKLPPDKFLEAQNAHQDIKDFYKLKKFE